MIFIMLFNFFIKLRFTNIRFTTLQWAVQWFLVYVGSP